jgi:hypothetical protein
MAMSPSKSEQPRFFLSGKNGEGNSDNEDDGAEAIQESKKKRSVSTTASINQSRCKESDMAIPLAQ